jgi:hypothetical protein
MILPTDMYPKAIGAVAGLVDFGGAMGGVVFGRVVGGSIAALCSLWPGPSTWSRSSFSAPSSPSSPRSACRQPASPRAR